MIPLPRLKEIRKRKFLSQEELARRANMSESKINRLEQGVQLARYVTVRKLAGALGVEPEELSAQEPGGKVAA